MQTIKEKSSPPFCCFIVWPILIEDQRKKNVRHYVVPNFGRILELIRDNFHRISESHKKGSWEPYAALRAVVKSQEFRIYLFVRQQH